MSSFRKAYEYLDFDFNDSKVEYSCKAKFRIFADLSFDVTALFVLWYQNVLVIILMKQFSQNTLVDNKMK